MTLGGPYLLGINRRSELFCEASILGFVCFWIRSDSARKTFRVCANFFGLVDF